MGDLANRLELRSSSPNLTYCSMSDLDTRSSRSTLSSRPSLASITSASTKSTFPERFNSFARPKTSRRLSYSKQRKDFIQHHVTNSLEDNYGSLDKPQVPFSRLPDEVLSCIVDHVREIGPRERYQHVVRDLCCLSLASLRWHAIANQYLYRTLWIPTSSFHSPPRRFILRPKSKLKLLRRTLYEKPHLANYVHEIHVLDFPYTEKQFSKDMSACCDSLASVVAACPELRRVTGFNSIYRHKRHPLLNAVSTRPKLKEHTWLLGPTDDPSRNSKNSSRVVGFQSLLDHSQVSTFVELNSRFELLETLAITCLPDGACNEAFFTVFRCLPALQDLHLSNLASSDFKSTHLQYLPPALRSLRLESLPGISELGLFHYFLECLTLSQRDNLRNLALIDMDVRSISNLAALLDQLYNLRRLILITSELFLSLQDPQNEIPQPYLSSQSLRHLHWEHGDRSAKGEYCDDNYQEDDSEAILANSILADSVLADGFPRLESLCSPLDPEGIIQSVCKPIPRPVIRAAAAGADVSIKQYHDPSAPQVSPLIHRATSTKFGPDAETEQTPPRSRKEVHAAAAYERAAKALRPSRRMGTDQELGFRFSVLEDLEPYITLYVYDETEMLEAMFEFAPFVGRLGCNVPEYVLQDGEPFQSEQDVPNSVVGLNDILESGGKIHLERLFR